MSEKNAKEYVLVVLRADSSADLARDLLRDVGIEFREVCQDDLPSDDPLRCFSSPSLLENGEIIFGARLKGIGSVNTVSLPTEYELLTKLTQVEDEELTHQ